MTDPDHIRRAARAHTNLSMFHAIMALAESGGFYGDHPELTKIVALAQKGAQRQLRAYDEAVREAVAVEGEG